MDGIYTLNSDDETVANDSYHTKNERNHLTTQTWDRTDTIVNLVPTTEYESTRKIEKDDLQEWSYSGPNYNNNFTQTVDSTQFLKETQAADGAGTIESTREDHALIENGRGGTVLTNGGIYSQTWKLTNDSQSSTKADVDADGTIHLTNHSASSDLKYETNGTWDLHQTDLDHVEDGETSEIIHSVTTFSGDTLTTSVDHTKDSSRSGSIVVTHPDGSTSTTDLTLDPPAEHTYNVSTTTIDTTSFIGRELDPGSWESVAEREFGVLLGEALDVVSDAWNTVVYFSANHGAQPSELGTFLEHVGNMVLSFGAGVIDAFADTINPFDQWASIPDIGPIAGYETAYNVGQVAGTVVGVTASIYIGNVAGAGSGLIQCGSLAQKAIKLYNTVDTIAGIASSAQHIATTGTVGLGDILNLAPIVGLSIGKYRASLGHGSCFVAGTEVVMDDSADELLSAAETDESMEVSFAMIAALAIPVTITSSRTRRRRKMDERDLMSVADRVFADAELDDLWLPAGQLLDPPSHGEPPAFMFRPELDALCDGLFSETDLVSDEL